MWTGRVIAALAAVCLLLACAGFAYQTIATDGDQRAHPAPGTMINVDGRSVHLRCTGQGSPTVILETGLGSWSSHWALVQPVITQTTRVCSYDRAGLGWSDAGLAPRDAVGPGSSDEVRVKSEMDAETVALSTNSRHVIVCGATHTGLAVNPDHAGVTSAAIREVVDAVRSGHPLKN